MRRVLNLNHPGTILLKIAGLFLVAIPAILYCALRVLGETATLRTFLPGLIKTSFAIGASVLVILSILIIIEQVQDHYIDVQYQKNRSRKLALADGNYECQYCGNQKVKENDKTCWVCGKDLT